MRLWGLFGYQVYIFTEAGCYCDTQSIAMEVTVCYNTVYSSHDAVQ